MRQFYRLCIILVNYNGFLDTKMCLDSIKESEDILPFIIIVDNASKDTRKLEELHKIYPILKIIYNHENIGFGRANNVGIKWVEENLDFEYLLLLNNDTIVTKNAFSYLIDAFNVSPNIGITTAKIMYDYDRSLVWYGGGEINYKRGWPKIADYNQPATLEGADKSRYVTFVSGCVMMFTRASISKIGGFDEDFFMYCEDLELCMRMKNVGFELYYNSNAIIYHKVQGSTRKGKNEKTGYHPKNSNLQFLFYNMQTNLWYSFKKNLPLSSFLIFACYYWLDFIKRNIYFLSYGRFDILPASKKIISKIIRT